MINDSSICQCPSSCLDGDGLCADCGGDVLYCFACGNVTHDSHHCCKAARMKDNAWILDHADELKQELLKLAEAGEPRPAPDTLLGRALDLFTQKGK
jgi:hypothetical protein